MSAAPKLDPCPICGEAHLDKSRHGCVLADLDERLLKLEGRIKASNEEEASHSKRKSKEHES